MTSQITFMIFAVLLLIIPLLPLSTCENSESLKEAFCSKIRCNNHHYKDVCGIKVDGAGVRLRVFANECELLKFGCNVKKSEAYGLTSMEFCRKSRASKNEDLYVDIEVLSTSDVDHCSQQICLSSMQHEHKICAMGYNGTGYRVTIFENQCEMDKYNCIHKVNFTKTDDYICYELLDSRLTREMRRSSDDVTENLVVIPINKRMFSTINESLDNFFSATHFNDLHLREVPDEVTANMTRRGMQMKIIRPLKLFKPWIVKPKNVSYDMWHMPTLRSCFHKCPTKCPDTYAPVCGVPGNIAREPSLVFKNHCFMDMAQCKMWWADASPTAQSSAYIETTFLFCLGDSLNNLYRFLPVLSTLKKLGRIKKNGQFKYRVKSLRFLNDRLTRDFRIMG